MKNLYLLPTDKPSRIMLRHGKLFFFKDDDSVPKGSPKNQHIYIISDDEIKHGDFVISMVNDVIEVAKISMMVACSYNGLEHCKKIVLTTDQDLIQDSIQSIPDEFLEWFVNNPSCDSVELKPWFNEILSCCKSESECSCNKKRIVLPNDEYINKIDNKNLLYSMQDLEDAWENGYISYEEEISGRKYTFEQWFNSIKKITK